MLKCFAWLAAALCFSVGAGAEEVAKPSVVVGTIDFFGLRQLSESAVRDHLRIKEGDPFDRSQTSAVLDELRQLPGVKMATLAPITTSEGLRLFVGIQEENDAGFVLLEAPAEDVRLPEPLMQIFRDFGSALGPAVRSGKAQQDNTQGHSLTADPEMRRTEDAALATMKDNVATVTAVLKTSAHREHRRAAAWLLGYAPDKRAVVDALVEAARDSDAGVRNNATRALGAIAVLADLKPELGIRIDPSVFIAMLGSLNWTDRNKAGFVLKKLTKSKSPELLHRLRDHAMPELIEIARWKSTGHAFGFVMILGRIAGWSDAQTTETWAWGKGDVEAVIAAALASRQGADAREVFRR